MYHTVAHPHIIKDLHTAAVPCLIAYLSIRKAGVFDDGRLALKITYNKYYALRFESVSVRRPGAVAASHYVLFLRGMRPADSSRGIMLALQPRKEVATNLHAWSTIQQSCSFAVKRTNYLSSEHAARGGY